MNSSREPGHCVRGKDCLHLENNGDGKLPYHAFNRDPLRRGSTRRLCRVCISFRNSCQDGAKAEIASRFNGDLKAAVKALQAKKKSSVDAFEAAVLLGISESQVGSLVNAGKLHPSTSDGSNFDKAFVLALSEQPETLAHYRFRSSWEYWNKHNRKNLSDKIPDWAKLLEEPQTAFIDEQSIEYGQQYGLPEADVSEEDIAEIAEFYGAWLDVADAYRDGVNDLLKRIEPHAQALGETPMSYLQFFAPGLYAAIRVHDEVLKRFAGEQNIDVTTAGVYPPPTFTPPAYDDLGEIADDNHLYISGGHGDSPQWQRIKLFGGNGTKED